MSRRGSRAMGKLIAWVFRIMIMTAILGINADFLLRSNEMKPLKTLEALQINIEIGEYEDANGYCRGLWPPRCFHLNFEW